MTLAHAAVVKNIKNVAVNKVNKVNKLNKRSQDDRRKETENNGTFREILFFKGLSLT